jgi:hypothetical protein
MVKLFKKNPTFSSKDYTERKRNRQLYCDLSNTNEARHLGQTFNNGKIKSTVNQSSLLNLTKGYYDYNQNTLNTSCFFEEENPIEKFTYSVCTETESSNTSKNSNYTGERLVTAADNTQTDNDTKYAHVIEYAEIQTIDPAILTKEVKTEKRKKFMYPISNLSKIA